MNVKVKSLLMTLKTVFGGSRTKVVFVKRVSDDQSGDLERSLSEPHPCPWRVVVVAVGALSDLDDEGKRKPPVVCL